MLRSLLALALVSFALVMGCGRAIQPCRCTTPAGAAATMTAPADRALVIVMHPGHTVGSVNVLDENGAPIGAVDHGELMTITLAPGAHTLYGNMGGSDYATNRNFNALVELTVDAGHVYYVTATAGPLALRVVTPASRDDRWAQRQTWVSSCSAVAYTGAAPDYFADAATIMQTARARFTAYDDAHHAEHVAAATDAD